MTSRRRKIIAFFVILIGILALTLIIFGLYIRFPGAGNPVGSVYMLRRFGSGRRNCYVLRFSLGGKPQWRTTTADPKVKIIAEG